jgi:excisionase family DNA binding protein
MGTPNHEWMTLAEVAEHLQVPLATVYRWSSAGMLPRRVRLGKHVRIRRDWLEEWLDEQAA